MKRILSKTAILIILGLMTAFSAWSETTLWISDPANTTSLFVINHSRLLDVHGSIPKVSGSVRIDDQDFTKSQFNLTAQVSSLNTNDAMETSIMKSAACFDVAKYPTITFVSNKITPAQGGKFKVTGTMTMHGVTKEVTFDLDPPSRILLYEGTKYRAFQLNTTINRKDFGLTWDAPDSDKPKLDAPLFADDVKIMIIVEVVNPPLPAHRGKMTPAQMAGHD